MMEKQMETYWCWLCSRKELYRPHLKKLLTYFETPKAVFEAPDRELDKCTFLGTAQRECLKEGKREDNIWHETEKAGIRFISAEHEDYPGRLREIPDYPYGLFLKGRLPGREEYPVAMVGARRCSSYGKRMSEKMAEALASCGVSIISGMALGIDSFSQQAALDAGGSSYGVLGCGADVCYPQRNRKLYERLIEQGGIISEFPPGREPLAHHFPIRNRIISGMAESVLVIEARERSGSLITADLALDQGREILAVPGRIGDTLSGGCNRLIGQGAGIILSVDHLLEILSLSAGNRKNTKNYKIPLETKENLVYSCVDFQPVSLDGILQKTNLPVQEVMGILAVMVLKGYIEEPMKNYYIKTN